jgi:outer membrane protein
MAVDMMIRTVLLILPVSGATQTLMGVYEKARLQDPQFMAAQRTLEAALERSVQARSTLLPNVSLSGGKNVQTGRASFSDEPFVERDVQSWTWSIQLTQPLFRWGNWLGWQQADAVERQAQEQFAVAQQELILRTAQVYFDVLVAQENVLVMQSQLQAVDEQLALAQRTYAVGTGTITDVHEALAKKALSQSQRVGAINELTIKMSDMERLLGEQFSLAPVKLIQDVPAIQDSQLVDWLTGAIEQNPQVKMQLAALDVAKKEVAKSQAAHLPTLDLVLNAGGNFNSGSLSSPADIPTRVRSQQVGLQLNVPLFTGGATQSKVREALALATKAQEDVTLAQRNAASQVRQAFAGVMNGQAQVEALQAAVAASRNAVESNKIGFLAGTRINPDVLNSEQQLYSSLRDLTKARMEVLMQGLRLKAAVGVLKVQDLATVDHMLGLETVPR